MQFIKTGLIGGGIAGTLINSVVFVSPLLLPSAAKIYAAYASTPFFMAVCGGCIYMLSILSSMGLHYIGAKTCGKTCNVTDVENPPEVAAAPQAGYEAIADSVNTSVEGFLHDSPISQPSVNAYRRAENVAVQPKPEPESWWPKFNWN